MMTLISAVTTSMIINVTTILIATAAPVESSSSDLLTHVPIDRVGQYYDLIVCRDIKVSR